MIELVVFDFDGTLADSESRIVRAMRAAFAGGGETPPAPAAIRAIIGLDLEGAIRRLGSTGAAAARLAADYRRHYASAASSPAPLFPHAAHILEALAGAHMALAIATGAHSRARLLNSQPAAVIDALHELPAVPARLSDADGRAGE